MKKLTIFFPALVLAGLALAQNPSSNSQAAQTAPPQPVQSTGAKAAPARKLPQAKTQAEYQAFQQVATQSDPAQLEKATDEFVVKYPDSELKAVLYQQLMFLYQNANNADKTLEMGHKVLAGDPDSVLALVMTAMVLSERTRDTDLDKDERFAEATKNAEKAIETMDAAFTPPPNFTPEQTTAAKSLLLANAYSALGAVQMNAKDDAGAEKNFQKAVQLNQSQPDALTYLRLAISQDHQRKYKDALVAANKAVELSKNDSSVLSLAKQEQARLTQLTGVETTTPSPPPGATIPKN